MKRLFFVFLAILGFIISITAYAATHPIPQKVFPNTYLADTLISEKSPQEVEKFLEGLSSARVQIKIKGKLYTYSYPAIGVDFNKEEVLSALFPSNHKVFPNNYISYIGSFFTKREVVLKAYTTAVFDNFISNTIFDQTSKKDEISVDNNDKLLIYIDNQENYKINDPTIKNQIINGFGKNAILTPSFIKLENVNKYSTLSYNDRIKNIFFDNIYIKTYDLEKNFTSAISTSDIKRIVDISYETSSQKPTIKIHQTILADLLNNFINGLGLSDKKPYVPEIISGFSDIVAKRFDGEKINTLNAKIDYQPKTDGKLALKYLEIDKSQQTMYVFEEGKLIDKHTVSTGLYYPTPVGEFKILNKALNAYSDIYNVWMPYWMAFYFGPEVQAYFGIHELPYWFSGGTKITRPREFLGSPHTGGCISLDIGAAKKVYDWADIGTPVYVFD